MFRITQSLKNTLVLDIFGKIVEEKDLSQILSYTLSCTVLFIWMELQIYLIFQGNGNNARIPTRIFSALESLYSLLISVDAFDYNSFSIIRKLYNIAGSVTLL